MTLYFNELRYKIESLSQRGIGLYTSNETVFQWTKIQNWKLITTVNPEHAKRLELYFNELRYKIESLSQQRRTRRKLVVDCISMN